MLDLGGLNLTVIPSEIGRLKALETLNVHENQLTTLPEEIWELKSLKWLNLNVNKLKSLPSDICRLTSLVRLFVGANPLTCLPSEVRDLVALTDLYVGGTKLRAFPSEVCELVNLRSLYLGRNQLATIPSKIGQLAALRRLDLTDNRLSKLPLEIGKLAALNELYLHGNPKLEIPPSILGTTLIDGVTGRREATRPADILNFYFRRESAAPDDQLQPLNEIKVMLVGDGGAGKTSLRKFFTGKRHSKSEKETLGIVLDTFPLRCGDSDVTVRLWDFAGQEITHALHQFFLTEGCVYLVVVEPRSDNEESDAEKWLKLIRRYAGDAPVFLVLNKQDTRKPNGYDIDRNPLRERFPFVRGFQPTTCGARRVGCNELREELQSLIRDMPEATLPVPRSWIRVKDECFNAAGDGTKKHYLTLNEFRKLCARHGEKAAEKQESLARILHQLGAVLHFVDEPRLRDTAVLNPHWVTDGAYRLLRCMDRPKSDGVLTLREAVAAIPGGDKKAALYLLGLMERFEMCFPVQRNDKKGGPVEEWLIPGALDKNQPDEIQVAKWNVPDCVRLRYHYELLPQGVIPRFIVMTHPLSDGRPRWRNGVELVDGKARALLRKLSDSVVEVTILGPSPDRENLAKVMRGFLARIHADLPDPKPREFQELSGLPGEFREVRQMEAYERQDSRIVVATNETDVVRDATQELNRTSDEKPRTSQKRRLRVFLSYSQEDRLKQSVFRKNLMALENDGYIKFWDDPQIRPDMDWRPEIDRELETMDVFIGLLTTNFRTSKFVQRVEFKRAIERRKEKVARMWLILVGDCRISGTSYEGIAVIKPGGKPVVKHKSLQAGFDAAEKEIHQLIVELWESLPDVDEQLLRSRLN